MYLLLLLFCVSMSLNMFPEVTVCGNALIQCLVAALGHYILHAFGCVAFHCLINHMAAVIFFLFKLAWQAEISGSRRNQIFVLLWRSPPARVRLQREEADKIRLDDTVVAKEIRLELDLLPRTWRTLYMCILKETAVHVVHRVKSNWN